MIYEGVVLQIHDLLQIDSKDAIMVREVAQRLRATHGGYWVSTSDMKHLLLLKRDYQLEQTWTPEKFVEKWPFFEVQDLGDITGVEWAGFLPFQRDIQVELDITWPMIQRIHATLDHHCRDFRWNAFAQMAIVEGKCGILYNVGLCNVVRSFLGIDKPPESLSTPVGLSSKWSSQCSDTLALSSTESPLELMW